MSAATGFNGRPCWSTSPARSVSAWCTRFSENGCGQRHFFAPSSPSGSSAGTRRSRRGWPRPPSRSGTEHYGWPVRTFSSPCSPELSPPSSAWQPVVRGPSELEVDMTTLAGAGERLTIFIGENDQFHRKPLYSEIVHRAQAAGLAGATVVRG